jgi:hypothetical protein
VTTLKRRTDTEKKLLRPGEYMPGDNDLWVVYKCPDCGFLTSLGKKFHQVNYNGEVYPNVTCPHKVGSGGKCSFSQTVALADWVPEAKGSA